MSEEQNDRLSVRTEGDEEEIADSEAQACPESEEVIRLAAERNAAVHMAEELAEKKEAAESAARQLAIERKEAEIAAAQAAVERAAAERRAEESSAAATSSTFGFYLILGLLLALLIVGIIWILASGGRESVTVVRPGLMILSLLADQGCEVAGRPAPGLDLPASGFVWGLRPHALV